MSPETTPLEVPTIRHEHVTEIAHEVLARIQFPLLIDLFQMKLGKAHIEHKPFSKEIISFDPMEGDSQFDGTIRIGIMGLEQADPKLLRLELLVMIIHEMAHYFSAGRFDGEYHPYGVSKIRNGKDQATFGEGFNEGITELTALELARTYIAETGDRAYFLNDSGETDAFEQVAALSYGRHVEILSSVITKIASTSGMDEEKVWGAIQHAYYNNTGIASGEFYRALKETLGRDVAYQLVHTDAEYMCDPHVITGLLERLKPGERARK